MKRILLWVLLTVVVLLAGLIGLAMMYDTPNVSPPDDGPGYVTTDVTLSHRAEPVTVHVWYPADLGGTPEWIGRNGLFLGSAVRRDAPPRDGAHPVALMSHGSGGSGPRMGWLANALAADGWIVVSPDHPGTTSGDSSPEATVRIWERAEDFAAIDLRLPDILPAGLAVPETRVSVGFSLGGHTALALAGVRVSAEAFQADCATRSDYDCGWLARGGVDFSSIDADRYGADLRLATVQAVAAIDPALPAAMTENSLSAMTLPTMLINMGQPAPKAVRADGVAEALPNATFVAVPGAGHFAMLPECSRLGEIILGLSVREDENICARFDRARIEIQADVATAIVAFLATVR